MNTGGIGRPQGTGVGGIKRGIGLELLAENDNVRRIGGEEEDAIGINGIYRRRIEVKRVGAEVMRCDQFNVAQLGAGEVLRCAYIESEIVGLIGLTLKLQHIKAGASIDTDEARVDNRDLIITGAGIDHIGAAIGDHAITATNGVDLISQWRSNQGVIAGCAHLGGDIEIVATEQGVLVVDTLGRIGGIRHQHVLEAIAIDVDVAIDGVAGEGNLGWGRLD